MELERNDIPEEELDEGDREVANLFEQTCFQRKCAFNAYPKFH